MAKHKAIMAAILIGAALAPAGASVAVGGQEGQRMQEDRRIAVVRDMAAAWHARDWNRVAALFAEDGVLHSMMVEPIRGRRAIAARVNHLGAGLESITLNIRNIGLVNGAVFVERVDEFVYQGHAGRVPVVGVIEVGEDGLIREWREYYDRAELLRAMGLEQDFDRAGRE